MRTMLIPFLLCSLGPLAIVAQPPIQTKVEGCGTLYECFTPKHCREVNVPDDENKVTTTDASDKIFEDCNAYIKIHTYSAKWARVEIESRKKVEDVKEIAFKQQKTQGGAAVAIFSCKYDETTGNTIGTYEVITPRRKHSFTMAKKTPTLSCSFDVKLPGENAEIFKTGDYYEFEIDTKRSLSSKVTPFADHCDPSYFNFVGEKREDKHYQKMSFAPGKFYCDNSKGPYAIDFRGETDEDFAIVEKVTCTGNTFLIHTGAPNPTTITYKDNIDIRCVADAKYFCDYSVKPKAGEEELKPQPPDHLQDIGRGLKCPTTHPYLFIRGNPVFKPGTKDAPEIECLNYGGSQLWTVLKETLTKEGPEAYCSNKLPCAHFYKIQEGSVKKGALGTDGFPKCHATGVLYDEQGGQPDNFRCDEQTGEYKYNVGTEEKKVEGMKFECKYAAIENVAQNQKNTKIIAYGSIGAGIGAAVLLVGAFFGIYYYTRHALKKERQKREAADAAAFIKYAMGADERKKVLEERKKKRAVEAKKSAPSSSSGNKSPQKKVWSKFLMAISQRATRRTVKPDAKWVAQRSQEPVFDTAIGGNFTRKNCKKLTIKPEQLKKSRRGSKFVKAYKTKYDAKKKDGFPYPQ